MDITRVSLKLVIVEQEAGCSVINPYNYQLHNLVYKFSTLVSGSLLRTSSILFDLFILQYSIKFLPYKW